MTVDAKIRYLCHHNRQDWQKKNPPGLHRLNGCLDLYDKTQQLQEQFPVFGPSRAERPTTRCWSVTDYGSFAPFCLYFQVMETERMIYLVTEYASGGEIFGKGLIPGMQTLFVVMLFSRSTVDLMPGIKKTKKIIVNESVLTSLCDLFHVLGYKCIVCDLCVHLQTIWWLMVVWQKRTPGRSSSRLLLQFISAIAATSSTET